MLQRYLAPTFIVFLLLTSSLLTQLTAEEGSFTPQVIVTIAPEKYLVNRIAQQKVEVTMLVPAGIDMHNFEPTLQQIVQLQQAHIWFRIGDTIENKICQAIRSHKATVKIVDLQEGLPLLPAAHMHTHLHEKSTCSTTFDIHTWLSPKLLQQQAKMIAQELIELCPDSKHLFEENLNRLLLELQKLDADIQQLLKPLSMRHILVAHGAFNYFCNDYNLKQITIEYEGKDPTSQQLSNILHKAKKYHIQYIFVEKYTPNKGAKLLAKAIGARIVEVDPHGYDLIIELQKFAQAIAGNKTLPTLDTAK